MPAPTHQPLAAQHLAERHLERLSVDARRGTLGAFYTPAWLVDLLLDAALEPVLASASSRGVDALAGLRICDPSCGCGAFLIPAMQRLARAFARMSHLDTPDASCFQRACACLVGVDIDPDALEITRLALAEASGLASPPALLRVGDALLSAPPSRINRPDADAWASHNPAATHWHLELTSDADGRCLDVVLGNPPFLNQLALATTRTREHAALLAARWGPQAAGYADAAGLFLLASLQLLRPQGRVGLVLPQSFLAASDAGPIRARVLREGTLRMLWASNQKVFADASVYTCAVTLEVGGPRVATPRLLTGMPPTELRSTDISMETLAASETWSDLARDPRATPALHIATARTLGEIASITADFRDEYYALRGLVIDERDRDELRFPRLLTSGLLDLARCAWGERATRLHKQSVRCPRIDLGAAPQQQSLLRSWATKRLVPKVLLATQTRVLEAFVDEPGTCLPVTPVITISPREAFAHTHQDALWLLAAAIASPACCALARARYAGAALSIDAIKLSAAQCRGLPMPSDLDAWRMGAHAFRSAQLASDDAARRKHLASYATAMSLAHSLSNAETVEAWWLARLRDRPRNGHKS